MLGGRHSQRVAAAELERTLKFTGTETDKGGGTTDFCLDDTAINVS